MLFGGVEDTRYATQFRETVTGAEYWRSGRFLGTLIIPEGQRPFPDRDAEYEVEQVHDVGETMPGDYAVFTAMENIEEDD